MFIETIDRARHDDEPVRSAGVVAEAFTNVCDLAPSPPSPLGIVQDRLSRFESACRSSEEILEQIRSDDRLIDDPRIRRIGSLANSFRENVLANSSTAEVVDCVVDASILSAERPVRDVATKLLLELDSKRASQLKRLGEVFSILHDVQGIGRVGVTTEDLVRADRAVQPLLEDRVAVYYLARYVVSSHGDARGIVGTALADSPHRAVINSIILPVLNVVESDPYFRSLLINDHSAAVRALDPRDDEALPVLLKIASQSPYPGVNNHDQNAVAAAIRKLGGFKDEKTHDQLYARFFQLEGDTWNVKSALAAALSKQLTPEMIKELIRFTALPPLDAALSLVSKQKLGLWDKIKLTWDLCIGSRKEELFNSQMQACLALEPSASEIALARIYNLTSHGNRWKSKASWFAHHAGINALKQAGRFNSELTDLELSLSDMSGKTVSPGFGQRFLKKLISPDENPLRFN